MEDWTNVERLMFRKSGILNKNNYRELQEEFIDNLPRYLKRLKEFDETIMYFDRCKDIRIFLKDMVHVMVDKKLQLSYDTISEFLSIPGYNTFKGPLKACCEEYMMKNLVSNVDEIFILDICPWGNNVPPLYYLLLQWIDKMDKKQLTFLCKKYSLNKGKPYSLLKFHIENKLKTFSNIES